MIFGEKILSLRKKKNLSQEELAEALNVSRQTISNWETNQVIPTIDKAKELSILFQISVDELLDHNLDIITNKKDGSPSILKQLVGKNCIIEREDGPINGVPHQTIVTILDLDDDWVKIQYVPKKGEPIIKLVDLDTIGSFKVIEEGEE